MHHISCAHESETVQADEQGFCPGYDDNGEVPIGWSVIKDDLIDMGVIHL